jgi:hypothetical protein
MANVRDEIGDQLSELISGLQTAVPSGKSSITVNAKVYTIAALIAALQVFRQLWTTAEDLTAKLHAAVQARNEQTAPAREFIAEVKPAIVALLGAKNPDLEKFGIKPRRSRKQLTGDQLAIANAKRQATRSQRGDAGARQKALEGTANVTQVTVTEPSRPAPGAGSKPTT